MGDEDGERDARFEWCLIDVAKRERAGNGYNISVRWCARTMDAEGGIPHHCVQVTSMWYTHARVQFEKLEIVERVFVSFRDWRVCVCAIIVRVDSICVTDASRLPNERDRSKQYTVSQRETNVRWHSCVPMSASYASRCAKAPELASITHTLASTHIQSQSIFFRAIAPTTMRSPLPHWQRRRSKTNICRCHSSFLILTVSTRPSTELSCSRSLTHTWAYHSRTPYRPSELLWQPGIGQRHHPIVR